MTSTKHTSLYQPVSSREVNFFLHAVDRLRSMEASCCVRDSALFSATLQNLDLMSVGERVLAALLPIQPDKNKLVFRFCNLFLV